MAKWGEGDPRWIVEDRPDSTNVNNWHWTEKNCFPWAEQYLRNALRDVKAAGPDGLTVSVKSVDNIEGDVTLGNRKGKIYNLYDLTIHLDWEDGISAEGTFKIGNVTQDDDVDDYEYDITCKDDNHNKRKLKELAGSKLKEAIKAKMTQFVTDLKAEFASKVLLPTKDQGSKMHGASTPPPVTGTSGATSAATTSEASVKSAAPASSGKSITVEVDLLASAQDVFDSLTQPNRAQIWSQGAVTLSASPGAEFSLYGGNVQGKMIETMAGKRIRQQWRLSSWPAGCMSDVTIELDQGSSSTHVRLRQLNIPEGHEEDVDVNWHRFYFDRMKAIFGWGIPSGL